MLKVHPTGSSNFKSGIERFTSSNSEVPGPGTYSLEGIRKNETTRGR